MVCGVILCDSAGATILPARIRAGGGISLGAGLSIIKRGRRTRRAAAISVRARYQPVFGCYCCGGVRINLSRSLSPLSCVVWRGVYSRSGWRDGARCDGIICQPMFYLTVRDSMVPLRRGAAPQYARSTAALCISCRRHFGDGTMVSHAAAARRATARVRRRRLLNNINLDMFIIVYGVA